MSSHADHIQQGSGFDKLARLYRWMEYCSFGPVLWRARIAFLPRMDNARSALVLGDGDGRFTAALLRHNRDVHVRAVDASAGMLRALERRAASQADAQRVRTCCADVTQWLPDGHFDLVCTHFFLDCLSDAQCLDVASRVVDRMAPGALWILSEFAVPPGRLRWPARLLVGGLYAAFGLLTGLRARRLPDYAATLATSGLRRIKVATRLGGILRSEVWLRGPERLATPAAGASNDA